MEKRMNMNQSVKFIFGFAILGAFLVCLGMSYAYNGENTTENSQQIIRLEYGLSSPDSKNLEFTLEPSESKLVTFEVTSSNPIETKYELYYDILTSGVDYMDIRYQTMMAEKRIDTDETQEVKVLIKNPNQKRVTVKFYVRGGMPNTKLEINHGFFVD